MRRSPLARPVTAVVAAALVAGALAGCTGASLGGDCVPQVAAGDASTAVSASGGFGSEPAVGYPTPLIAPEPERSVLIAGDGGTIGAGDVVLVDVTMFDGSSDDVQALGQITALVAANDSYRGFGASLLCATAGSRLALVGDPAALGLGASVASVVVIVDVEQVFLGKANGVNQLPQDGLPTVVTAVDGTPAVALAYTSPPEETRIATIKAGSGATIADGDTVVYHGRSWTYPATEGGKPSVGGLDTWANFQPRSIDVDASSTEPVDEALLGAKVGSQLLIVIPGTDDGPANIVVLDVLGVLADQ